MKRPKPPLQLRPYLLILRKSGLESVVDLVGHDVGSALDRTLSIADRLLCLALGFVSSTFGLKLFRPDGLADALLDVADRLIGEAGCLIGHAAHHKLSCNACDCRSAYNFCYREMVPRQLPYC